MYCVMCTVYCVLCNVYCVLCTVLCVHFRPVGTHILLILLSGSEESSIYKSVSIKYFSGLHPHRCNTSPFLPMKTSLFLSMQYLVTSIEIHRHFHRCKNSYKR